MLKNLKSLIRGSYYPLNLVTISKINLTSNYKYLSSLNKKIKIAPVLKSNAYGHGIVNVAKILEPLNPSMFCVDSLYEAYELSKAGIKTQILIMGYINSGNLKIKHLPFSYTVFDLNFAKELNKYQPGAKVHIKVDTGMNRLGVQTKDLSAFLDEIKKLKNINVVGLMSHLASANTSKAQTNSQIQYFKDARKLVSQKSFKPKWLHIAASDGLLSINKKVLSAVSNLARVGIALYGADGYGKTTPVLKLTSKVVQIKNVQKSEKIGYDGTYQAKSNMTIGMLPIGYNDGLDRRLSNKGYVIHKGKECKILGRISMNITAIDLTQAKNPQLEDEVTIFSNKTNDRNSFENAAKTCGTIPHDLLIHLHPTALRREIV